MGSFNTSCAVSSNTIAAGMPFTRIYLVPSWIREVQDPKDCRGSLDFYNTKGTAVSNDAAYAMFTPFGFPVKFIYEDYGDGKLVDEPNNVRNYAMICRVFGEDFNENSLDYAASDDRWIEYAGDKAWDLKTPAKRNGDILKVLTYCDVLTPVYEYLVKAEAQDNKYDQESAFEFYEEELKKITKYVKDKKGEIKLPITLTSDDEDLSDILFSMNIRVLPSLCKMNFIKVFTSLKLWDVKRDNDQLRDLLKFAYNLGLARMILRPSHYGGQSVNYDLIKGITVAARPEVNKYTQAMDRQRKEDEEWDRQYEEEQKAKKAKKKK